MTSTEFNPKFIDFKAILEYTRNNEKATNYKVDKVEGESQDSFLIRRSMVSSELLQGAAALAMLVNADKCLSYLVLYKDGGKPKVFTNKGTSTVINGDITRSGLCNSLVSLAENDPATFEIHVLTCNNLLNLPLSHIDLDFQNKLIKENIKNVIKPYGIFDHDCTSCKEVGTWCGCWTGRCY